MPKRRVRSAAQIASQRKASLASAAKRRIARSYSHPVNKKARQVAAYKAGQTANTPPGFGGRRSKLGGKAYVAKTGSNFKIAPEAAAILSGTGGFRNRRKSDIESHLAMIPLKQDSMHHNSLPTGVKVPVPKPEWRKPTLKPGPSQRHGSGTGLSSAFRYAKPLSKKRKAR